MQSESETLLILREEAQVTRASSQALTSGINKLDTRVEYLGNRAQRCDLVFYCSFNEFGKTWVENERKDLETCSTKLDIESSSSAIERAHRIGQNKPGKARAIIVYFLSYKVKNNLLDTRYKQKDANFS